MRAGRDSPDDLLVGAVEALLDATAGGEFRCELHRLWRLARERQREAGGRRERPGFAPVWWMGPAGFPAFGDALSAARPRLDWRSIGVESAEQNGATHVRVRSRPGPATVGD